MTADPFVSRLAETLSAAQHRWRTRAGFGAVCTPRMPPGLIDELAAGLAPLLRDLVAEAVAEQAVTR